MTLPSTEEQQAALHTQPPAACPPARTRPRRPQRSASPCRSGSWGGWLRGCPAACLGGRGGAEGRQGRSCLPSSVAVDSWIQLSGTLAACTRAEQGRQPPRQRHGSLRGTRARAALSPLQAWHSCELVQSPSTRGQTGAAGQLSKFVDRGQGRRRCARPPPFLYVTSSSVGSGRASVTTSSLQRSPSALVSSSRHHTHCSGTITA